MKIIYNNLADTATAILASTTASNSNTPSNLQSDFKGVTWRSAARASSATSVTATLAVQFADPGVTGVGGIVLPFTNLQSTVATIEARFYTGATRAIVGGTADAPTYTAGSTLILTTGDVNCCQWNWGNSPSTAPNLYSYGQGTYARLWLSPAQLTTLTDTACTSMVLVIKDVNRTNTTGHYIDVSRLIMGPIWEPTYNTSFGLTHTIVDMSTHDRVESGDLISKRGPRYNSLDFDLKWLTQTDRLELVKMIYNNGLPKPLVISLFPNFSEAWDQERSHMIYGKLMQLPGISHFAPGMFSSKINIEEV